MKQKFLPVNTKVSCSRYKSFFQTIRNNPPYIQAFMGFWIWQIQVETSFTAMPEASATPGKADRGRKSDGNRNEYLPAYGSPHQPAFPLKSTDSLKISVASACKTNLFHNTVFHLCFDTFAARSLSRKIYIHKVVLMISICNKTAEAYKESKFPAHLWFNNEKQVILLKDACWYKRSGHHRILPDVQPSCR